MTPWFSLYRVHKLFPLYIHCDIDLWPLNFKINRVHPHCDMPVKFKEDSHIDWVSIVFFVLLAYCHIHCDLDLWPLASNIDRDHPLVNSNFKAASHLSEFRETNGDESIKWTKYARMQRIQIKFPSNHAIINYCQIWSTNGKRRINMTCDRYWFFGSFLWVSYIRRRAKEWSAPIKRTKNSDDLIWREIGKQIRS